MLLLAKSVKIDVFRVNVVDYLATAVLASHCDGRAELGVSKTLDKALRCLALVFRLLQLGKSVGLALLRVENLSR